MNACILALSTPSRFPQSGQGFTSRINCPSKAVLTGHHMPVDGSRRRDSGAGAADYARLVDAAAGQLRAQATSASGPGDLVVMIPVVGFAKQSHGVIDRTVRLIAAELCGLGGRFSVVSVVNRPVHQAPDGTAAALRALRDELADEVELFVCDMALQRRPRVGELRQLAVDAVERVWGPLPGATSLVVCDDDVTAFPSRTLAGLRASVAAGEGLAAGPVLFDDPEMPMWRFADLYSADVVRALVGDCVLGALDYGDSGAPQTDVLESLIFSGNHAVRRDALGKAGGFRDLNEITWLARDVVATHSRRSFGRPVRLEVSSGDPVELLRDRAVRISSRRALAAWRLGGHPTVAQWRGCRFLASRVDPVRVRPRGVMLPDAVVNLGADDRQELVRSFGRAVTTTCQYLQPVPDYVEWALGWLGFRCGDFELRSGGVHGLEVRVRCSDGFLDWLVHVQAEMAAAEAAEREESLPVGFLPAGRAPMAM